MAVYAGILHSRRDISSDIFEFTIKIDSPAFKFTAGQYVSITLPGLEDRPITEQFHDFSIASSAHDSGKITVVYRNSNSIYKTRLRGLALGSEIEIEGPGGIFTYDAAVQPQAWIAGGVGITPFLSMIRSGLPTSSNIELLYYARSFSDYVYIDELKNSDITLHCLAGIITADNLQISHKPRRIMIAGPPSMVSTAKDILIGQGFAKAIIKTEEFSGYDT